MKLLLSAIKIVILVYIVFGIGMWLFQDDILFPGKTRDIENCDYPAGTKIWEYAGEKGYLYEAKQENRKLLIFYHGNAENACNWRFLGSNHVSELGYDTLVIEYPGYWPDGRETSKEAIYASVIDVQKWAEERQYTNVVVAGYSLGSAAATHHTKIASIDAAILFAPYDSIKSVLYGKGFWYPSILLRNNFSNTGNLKNSTTSMYIVYGTDDAVIPSKNTQRLITFLENQNTPLTVYKRENLDHKDLLNGKFLDTLLQEVLTN